MPDRKRKVKLIYVVLAVGISGLACLFLYLSRHSLIINYGIRFFRNLRNGVFAVSAIVSLIAIGLYIADWIRQQRWQKDRAAALAQDQEKLQESQKEKDKHKEVLSVSKKMDSQKVRELLEEYAAQKWSSLSQPLMQIKMQLDMMDEHQEKLSHLLDANGADALANTEDILDRVEQYLCKNVRKVLNYMDVADSDEAKDVQLVQDKLQICHEEGQKQLQQVQEFLFALAEFLNKQGEDDNSMEMLDIYKSTILSSIEDDWRKEK
ncbi:hypothetical protein [Hominifimenecus sp. rT4P-3]|uniref:hypothetical protein n=1 Tax=Hominifimenecus sp. rT4P-3 TaxID=3242979 RepID=UPI003DA42694